MGTALNGRAKIFLLLIGTPIFAAVIHAAGAQAVVSVDWGKVLRTVDAKAYGVDCPACFDPAWTHSPKLMKPLAEISAGAKPLIRLHGWGMVTQGSNECWLNADNTWNSAKIMQALTPC